LLKDSSPLQRLTELLKDYQLLKDNQLIVKKTAFNRVAALLEGEDEDVPVFDEDADWDATAEAVCEAHNREVDATMAPAPAAAPPAKVQTTAATIMSKACGGAAPPPGFVAAVGDGAASGATASTALAASIVPGGAGVGVGGAAPGVGMGAPPSGMPSAANFFATLGTTAAAPEVSEHPGSELAQLRALVIQLAARVRTLEHTQYAILMAPTPSKLSTEPGAGLAQWKVAITTNPAIGAADPLLGICLLKGVSAVGLPDGSDQATRARFAVAMLLLAVIHEAPLADVGYFWKHMVVADLGGKRAGSTLLSFYIEGRASLPDQAATDEVIQAYIVAQASGDTSPLKLMAARSFKFEDDIPVAAVGHGTALQHLLSTLICCLGGSKPSNRAPPGRLEYAVRGKGRGRGRGRGR